MTAIALTIAGSDSSGGAGIQADLKTFSALGVYGASVITALTAQNTQRVDEIMVVPPEFVLAQLRSAMSDLAVNAIKIGMLGTAGVIDAVVEGLSEFPGVPVVLDPVMVATSGDPLLDEDAVESLVTKLIPLATLITPNRRSCSMNLRTAARNGWRGGRRDFWILGRAPCCSKAAIPTARPLSTFWWMETAFSVSTHHAPRPRILTAPVARSPRQSPPSSPRASR
jgi:hypothetical protein